MTPGNSRRVLGSICFGLSLLAVIVVVMETKTAASRAPTGAMVNNINDQSFFGGTILYAGQQTPAVDKPTEQVEKNIQVLKGLPQSQLIPVMNFFNASLGVRCNFCHVNNNGAWAFDSDDKPEKKAAREMITMVLGINKASFRGNTEVSCFTCHGGRTHPQGVPQFPLAEAPRPEPPAQPGAAAPAKESAPTADQIIEKYAAALGDPAAIDKVNSRVLKGNVLAANGISLGYEVYQAMPSGIYAVLISPRQGTIERGFNGTVGWEKNQRGLRDLDGEALSYLLRYPGPVIGAAKLRAMYTRLGFGGKDKIDGRDVYVLRGTTTDNKRERLWFDAQTGLLVRRVVMSSTMIGVIPEQADYDDYRDVDGVKMPFTIKVSALDQNYSATLKFTEIKMNVPVDAAKFNKPAPPAVAPKP